VQLNDPGQEVLAVRRCGDLVLCEPLFARGFNARRLCKQARAASIASDSIWTALDRRRDEVEL
jgi:hypothetical protein